MANDIPPPFPPPSPPPVQQQKKGLPALAWAGIGCGGLVIIAGVLLVIGAVKAGKSLAEGFSKVMKEHPAKEAVQTVFDNYPAYEKTAENAEAGTFTLRVKSGGEEVPTTYDDWLHGKVTIKDAGGASVPALQGDLSKIPSWVPRYPGSTGVGSLLHQETSSQIRGILVVDTTDSKDDIEAFFEARSKKLSGSSSASSKSSSEINGKRNVSLSYSGGKQKFEVQAYGMPGSPMTVVVIYTEQK